MLSTLLAAVAGALCAGAFPVDIYAPSSVLSQGHWVKVSVTETGVQFIPAATLRSWGFSDPSKIKVYGYGGTQISNNLSRANYIDDLPAVQSYATADGIYFYGEGVEWYTNSGNNIVISRNLYTDEAYYFLTTDGAPEAEVPQVESEGTLNQWAEPVTVFTQPLQHEKDLVTLSQSGLAFLGEDFRYNRTQTFGFKLDDFVAGSPVWIRTSFVAKTTSLSNLYLSFNGQKVPGMTVIKATTGDDYASRATATKTYRPTDDISELAVGLEYSPNGTVQAAHLDYITVNYKRHLRIPTKTPLRFRLSTTTAALANAGAVPDVKVWDVTDPHKIIGMNLTAYADTVAFTNPYTGTRTYVAWSETMALPRPKYVGTVANQNLHGYEGNPDMVIFTVPAYLAQANRLAAIHTGAPEHLDVLVVVQDQVFNEFSSGKFDPGAFRKMLKMFYDRGLEAGKPLQYAIMFGRPTFDNRNITGLIPPASSNVLATWQSDESVLESNSFTSDDIYAMLEDNSGSNFNVAKLCIAVGRIPARNVDQARTYVDKLIAYNNNTLYSQWKNNVLLVADNGNAGVFMTGNEKFQANIAPTPHGKNLIYNKVYIDAFNIQSSICAQGRERFHRLLEEGVMWWNYVGHGAINTLSSENILTNADINDMYNKHWPVFFGATCSFCHWDGEGVSGSEIMSFNPDGGIIASIAPTRKAYIDSNNIMVELLGRYLLKTDDNGMQLTLGQTITAVKNVLIEGANLEGTDKQVSKNAAANKLRYVLLGDPAMRLTKPDNIVRLDKINDEEVTENAQVTIKARQRVTFTGSVLTPDGQPMPDFNGKLWITLYDAEYSTTSQGKPADGTDGVQITFEEMGAKLYAGMGTVKEGIFTATVEMPSEVSDNFRPATLNMYAVADDGRQASGANRDFYVYGYDYDAADDDTPPTIEYAYLNHESFEQGGIVNERPTFIARVSDDVAINMSMAGIGHQMSLKLDDKRTYSDVPLYFSPSTDGSPSGTIAYPMGELSEGNHTLAFRVWDAAGNSTTHLLQFYVQPGATPQIFDIYPDASPATDRVNFYITHNRPDAAMSVSLDIYDMAGRQVWTTTQSSRSDLWLSSPITWNLCDFSGRRVPRGIYIYRATVTIDGNEIVSPAKRIAVAAP